jgi:two-component system sensor histidine kinase UhpB
MTLKRSPLYRRVFLLNAAIFVVATVTLLVTPATVSFPVELTEAIVLVVGLAAILVVNALALRAAFAPLTRLARHMRDVDLRRPGGRLEATGPAEVEELVLVFNAMLDRLESERQQSGQVALAAQESERLRIAQELHDEVGQALTAILLRLERVVREVPAGPAEEIRSTQDAVRDAIEHVSRVVRRLRPEALADLGLPRALAALAARVQEQSGLRITQHVVAELDDLGDDCELVVYRVAQEALTNAARHSNARRVELSLVRSDGQLVLRVRDDGVGLPATLPDRHGIAGMRERAIAIGAALTVENADSGGVEVRLAVPVAP